MGRYETVAGTVIVVFYVLFCPDGSFVVEDREEALRRAERDGCLVSTVVRRVEGGAGNGG